MPPTGDTHFRIASITKTMTSAVVVQLAQERKLRFGDPISKYVPNVPNGRNITIDQLLTMRSGLYGYTDDPGFAATLGADPAKVWTPQEVLAIAFRHPPKFNSFSGYDPGNKVTVVIWSNLTMAPDSRPTANVLLVKVLGQIHSLLS